MGLNVAGIKYLALMKEKFNVDFDNVAMLGRQDLVVSDIGLQNICNLLGYQNSVDSLRNSGGFSENIFFNLFQSKKVDSLDYCDYEGATISLDLNEPISDTCDEQYEFVLDGGTLEHVFNYPIALQNAMRMCKRGGHLVLITPSNNYNGHGFYQFSPELFLDVLIGNGFCIEDISYVEEYGNEIYKLYKVEGISENELNTERRACIHVCAKKIDSTPSRLIVQQSRWKAMWGKNVNFMQKNHYLCFYDLNREIKNKLKKGIKEDNDIFVKNILLYGAGKVCQLFLDTFNLENVKIVGIADRNAKNINIEGFLVEEFTYFKTYQFDYIVITADKNILSEIRRDLINIYACCESNIMTLEEFKYYLSPCLFEGK